jgi:hypothetical protein
MTIEEFLDPANLLRNQYLDEPEFVQLYVRKGRRAIVFAGAAIASFPQVVQLARIEAVQPRSGALTRLIERIDHCCGWPIYIENILDKDVAKGLVNSSLGFTVVDVMRDWDPSTRLFRKGGRHE